MSVQLCVVIVTVGAMFAKAGAAQTALDVFNEFRAIDWDSRAKMAKADPADEAWRVRIKAEHLLIGMGEAVVPDLIAALADENRHVRGLAAQSLGAIGSPAALDPLIDRLESDSDAIVRVYAAEALGRLGEGGAETALAKAETDANFNVAFAAHTAKERLLHGPPAGPSLRDAARSAEAFASLAAPRRGEPAPDFDMPGGEGVRLSSLRGKPVVVLFQLADW